MRAKILENVSISNTIAISDLAKKLRADGKDVISLSMGEPDFDTPDIVKRAAIKAIKDGHTNYTALPGIIELREMIVEKFLHDNSLSFNTSEIMITNGAKQSIFNALLATLNNGDNVLVPAPYWVSYPDMVSLAGATPRICKTNHDNILEPEELEKNIDNNTKWLILNSPSNPSGAVYSMDDLRKLAKVLNKYPHVHIISDDVYEKIIYDKLPFYNIINAAPELKSRTIVINAVSKSYAMTGWRIGYAAGPECLIKDMLIVQSQSTSCASSISQYAAVEALRSCSDFIDKNIHIFQDRRDMLLHELSSINGISFSKPQGAFYLLLSCNNIIARAVQKGMDCIKNDVDLASFVLKNALVAVVPGSDFGMPGTLRISYASSKEVLFKAVKRMSSVFNSI
ncbi:Aspartate/prephenate aminotransferase [Candidatus Xenohaliotis californiensis]|uniref:aspartate transaminase n=1 Tax=Candidatus Xenohaliotis californiensis TaxID=84677 RepID=A0ABM9N7N5_9RICK|nr:Aspartate/prephenate aminotransferase [Candidatus Xenohaliotis californiensis]